MKDYKQMAHEVLEKRDQHIEKKKKLIKKAGVIGAAALIIAAVVIAGVMLGNRNKKNSGDTELTAQGSSSTSDGTNPANNSNGENNSTGHETIDQPKNTAFEYVNDFTAYLTAAECAGLTYSDAVRQSIMKFSAESAGKFYKGATGNFVYSPLSLYLGLGLCAEIADEEKIADLYGMLGVKDKADLEQQIGNIIAATNYDDGKCGTERYWNLCRIANSIWTDNDSIILSDEGRERLRNASEKMFADLYYDDIQSEDAFQKMNKWVGRKTDDLVKEIPERPGFNDVMVLFNTLYFNKSWSDQLVCEGTRDYNFTLYSGEGKTIDMIMFEQFANNRYYKSENAVTAAMPYDDGSYCIFIRPEHIKDLEKVMENDLEDIISAYAEGRYEEPENLNFGIPAIDYETKTTDMQRTLYDMGLKSIFEDAEVSAFNGLVDENSGAYNAIYVGKIAQNSHIIMSEKGTMAAAVTEVELKAKGGIETTAVILDHPYAYIIMSPNNTPLFIGAVKEP